MLNFYKPQGLAVFALFFFTLLLLTTPRVYSQYALEFDGTNDYVTCGSAVGPNGTLMPAGTPPTWVSIANSKLGNSALQFNGSTQYVTFGRASNLNTKTFTVETWFKRTGTGSSSTTGNSGVPDMIPIISKGSPEAEGRTYNANYIPQ